MLQARSFVVGDSRKPCLICFAGAMVNALSQNFPLIGHILTTPWWVLGGVLAPSSHCSILIEIPVAGEASRENDLEKPSHYNYLASQKSLAL